MRGNTPRLWGGLMTPEFYREFWRFKHEKPGFDGEIMNQRKNGDIYYVIAHISPILNNQGTVIGYIGTEEDITESKKGKEQVETLNKFMIGRENKMAELKEEIRELKEQIQNLTQLNK